MDNLRNQEPPNRVQTASGPKTAGLRRDVTVWGSFMWGCVDVGADVYTALGLVMAAAQGGIVAAFALAGLVYIMIGLAYTELAANFSLSIYCRSWKSRLSFGQTASKPGARSDVDRKRQK